MIEHPLFTCMLLYHLSGCQEEVSILAYTTVHLELLGMLVLRTGFYGLIGCLEGKAVLNGVNSEV